MSATRSELMDYCDNLLQPYQFKDYCPNGLQVEGKSDIKVIVTGVSASLDLIKAAIKHKADLLLVHHGFFWRGESEVVTGIKRQRLKSLLQHDINLVAYHLPLDAHPVYGNNIQLAERLNFIVEGPLTLNNEKTLLWIGSLEKPLTGQQLKRHIKTCLGREPLHIPASKKLINTVAWCTGAAESMITQAVLANVDAYITGEVSLATVHIAQESNLHFFSAGHHATERYGIKALGDLLAAEFDIQHIFVNIEDPV